MANEEVASGSRPPRPVAQEATATDMSKSVTQSLFTVTRLIEGVKW